MKTSLCDVTLRHAAHPLWCFKVRKYRKKGCLALKMKASRFFETSQTAHPMTKVSHPRRPESSAAMLREPEISQMKVCLILGLYIGALWNYKAVKRRGFFSAFPSCPTNHGFNKVEHLSQWRFHNWYYARMRLTNLEWFLFYFLQYRNWVVYLQNFPSAIIPHKFLSIQHLLIQKWCLGKFLRTEITPHCHSVTCMISMLSQRLESSYIQINLQHPKHTAQHNLKYTLN